MKLEKLTASIVKNLQRNKICCYEYSPTYLRELCERYPLLNHICLIIDENPRRQGMHPFMGRTLKVCGVKSLECLNPLETSIVITSDYYREAYKKLSTNPVLSSSVNTVYFFANQETEYEEAYRAKYAQDELEDLILFRSGPHASSYVEGTDFSDNARALFSYMLENHFQEKYKLVWLVKDPQAKVFAPFRNIKNIEFLSFDWSLSEDPQKRHCYYWVLCHAKYLFFTDAYGFARNSRSDQIRIQLWHGCGFKNRVNFVRCEHRYEYTTVISDLYAKIHQDIYGLRADQMLVTGYAKQDWLFHPAEELWQQLTIPLAKKYIFWLPTFRTAKDVLPNLSEQAPSGQTGLPIADTFEKIKELDVLLESLNIMLVLKLHPFQENQKISVKELKNIHVLNHAQMAQKDIQINQLLPFADALISDYSSVAVDFMLLNRPMAFTLTDAQEYADSRGFVFDNIQEWLPGKELFSFADFSSFLKEVAEGRDSTCQKRQRLLQKMHRYKDDQSCQRIIEALHIAPAK